MSYRIRSAREKQQLVEAWLGSGVPKTRFALTEGVPPSSFAKWIRASEAPAGLAMRLVPVQVVDEPTNRVPLLVHVAGSGHRVEVPDGFDAGELRRLVDALC